jgi:hypothetical protein
MKNFDENHKPIIEENAQRIDEIGATTDDKIKDGLQKVTNFSKNKAKSMALSSLET